MIKKTKIILATTTAALLAATFGASAAHASIIFTASGNTPADGPASATATFDFLSPTVLQLVLTNNESGTAQGQSISGLNFSFSGFTLTGLTTATGDTINFKTNTTVLGDNILASGDGNWTASAGNSTTESITTIGGGQPFTLIMGPNGSPNGAVKNFEPYVQDTATFLFAITGKTDNATVSASTFIFGTSGEATLTGTPGGGNGRTPEPASLGILSVGALALLARRRHAR